MKPEPMLVRCPVQIRVGALYIRMKQSSSQEFVDGVQVTFGMKCNSCSVKSTSEFDAALWG